MITLNYSFFTGSFVNPINYFDTDSIYVHAAQIFKTKHNVNQCLEALITVLQHTSCFFRYFVRVLDFHRLLQPGHDHHDPSIPQQARPQASP